jgi:hypothetical protein
MTTTPAQGARAAFSAVSQRGPAAVSPVANRIREPPVMYMSAVPLGEM